jgi:hypothetical protein
MRFPREFYQIRQVIETRMPQMRAAQQTGLSLWVMGTVLAQSACQNAVVTALIAYGGFHTLRQYLREWLYNGEDRAAPCAVRLDVEECFAPLLRWLLSWWKSSDIALCIDATTHHDMLTALVVSVLYEGCAIPIAWHIRRAELPGEWIGPILRLFDRIKEVIPHSMRVIVLTDRGLWSRRIWQGIRKCGFHPVMRAQNHILFRPQGEGLAPARSLVKRPGKAWKGSGSAFSDSHGQLKATLVVVWGEGEKEPWVILTDLEAGKVGACWYGLRTWIELGFRALKGVGWKWENTRRTDPERVSRHWLVMAVSMLFVLAYGTRQEEKSEDRRMRAAIQRSLEMHTRPTNIDHKGVRQATLCNAQAHRREVSLFHLGLITFARQLFRCQSWRRLYLAPAQWQNPAPDTIELSCASQPP